MAIEVAHELVLLPRPAPTDPPVGNGVGLINLGSAAGVHNPDGSESIIGTTPWVDTSSTNSAPALSAAIAQAAKGGGVVEAPGGKCNLQSKVTFVEGVTVIGAGYGNTLFSIDDSLGNVPVAFQWSNLRYGGLKKCSITAPTVRTAGLAIDIRGGNPTVALGPFAFGAGQIEIDVDMDNQFNGYSVSDGVGCGNWGATLGTSDRQAIWRNFATGGVGVTWNSPSGGSHSATNIFIADNIGADCLAGFRVRGTGDVTLTGCSTWHSGFGFLLDNVNPICLTGALIKLIGNEFDSTSQAAGADCVKLAPGDKTKPIFVSMTGNWIAGGYNGVHAVGFSGANCNGIITGGIIYSNANWGVLGDSGTASSNLLVTVASPTVPGTMFNANTAGNIAFV